MSGLIYVKWVWHQLCYQWRGKQMLSTILVMLKQRSVLLLLRLTLLWHDKSKHCLRVSLDIPASQTLTPWDKAFCHCRQRRSIAERLTCLLSCLKCEPSQPQWRLDTFKIVTDKTCDLHTFSLPGLRGPGFMMRSYVWRHALCVTDMHPHSLEECCSLTFSALSFCSGRG